MSCIPFMRQLWCHNRYMRLIKGTEMALLGYARVSTNQQKLDTQIVALKAEGVRDDRIFSDKASGKNDRREGLQQLLQRAEIGDTIIITKMDRLGRNMLDMVRIVDECSKKSIGIKFLENGLDTSGSAGKMIVQILSAVAESERERILERTNDGRAAAMNEGVKFGRKPHKSSEQALEMIEQGKPAAEVMATTGVSRATYFRLKKSI